MVVGVHGNTVLFAEPAHFCDIRLNEVDGPVLDPRQEGLTAGKRLAGGYRERSVLRESYVSGHIIRAQGLFKPCSAVVMQHFCRFQGPLVPMRPKPVRGTRVNHQLHVRADNPARGFDDLFIFHYTDREGTRACSLTDKIPYDVKIRRLRELNAIQRDISKQRNEVLIGKTLDVLFEGASNRGKGNLAGRTRSNKVVNCQAPSDLIGKTMAVKIRKANIHSLTGTLI